VWIKKVIRKNRAADIMNMDLKYNNEKEMCWLGFLGFLGFQGFMAFKLHEPVLLLQFCLFSLLTYFGYLKNELKYL
jgi:hypothetical protein